MTDDIDRKLLELLQADARMSNVDLARHVEMAPSAVLERVRKLEERGYVTGYEARLNAGALGFGLTAYVLVTVKDFDAVGKVEKRLLSHPAIQEVHLVAGEDGFLVKVRAAGTDALAALVTGYLQKIPAVRSTHTTVVLKTLKETSALPLSESA